MRKKYTQKSVEKYFKEFGYKVFSSFINVDTKIEVKCPNGHDWQVSFYKFSSQGVRCRICQPRTNPCKSEEERKLRRKASREKHEKFKKENPELMKIKRKEWRENYKNKNPERFKLMRNLRNQRREERMREVEYVKFTVDELLKKFAQFDNSCAYCGHTENIEIEHIIPISKKGKHCLSNIIPACKFCNSSKCDRDLETWYKEQSFFDFKRLESIQDRI